MTQFSVSFGAIPFICIEWTKTTLDKIIFCKKQFIHTFKSNNYANFKEK